MRTPLGHLVEGGLHEEAFSNRDIFSYQRRFILKARKLFDKGIALITKAFEPVASTLPRGC
jgi:hypothetical protein